MKFMTNEPTNANTASETTMSIMSMIRLPDFGLAALVLERTLLRF